MGFLPKSGRPPLLSEGKEDTAQDLCTGSLPHCEHPTPTPTPAGCAGVPTAKGPLQSALPPSSWLRPPWWGLRHPPTLRLPPLRSPRVFSPPGSCPGCWLSGGAGTLGGLRPLGEGSLTHGCAEGAAYQTETPGLGNRRTEPGAVPNPVVPRNHTRCCLQTLVFRRALFSPDNRFPFAPSPVSVLLPHGLQQADGHEGEERGPAEGRPGAGTEQSQGRWGEDREPAPAISPRWRPGGPSPSWGCCPVSPTACVQQTLRPTGECAGPRRAGRILGAQFTWGDGWMGGQTDR